MSKVGVDRVELPEPLSNSFTVNPATPTVYTPKKNQHVKEQKKAPQFLARPS